jgi:hemoglobin
MTAATHTPNIFDAIGGAPAVAAATDALYDRLVADPQLARHFVGVDLSRLKSHVKPVLAAALGGPELYRSRDLRSAHAHLGITAADWDATVDHLVATLQSLGVPDNLIDEIGQRIMTLRDQIVSA